MTPKRILLFLVAFLLIAPAFGAMTYDQAYYRNNRAYLGSGGSNDPLYNLFGTVEGLYEGTSTYDAISILESTGATYYTKIQGGNQSANLTLTLPTAYAATTGYVLSSTDAGVLSWVANGGTFTGGNITSDVTLAANGVDILADTTTAHTFAIQARDIDGSAYVDILRMTNGDTAAMVLGAATVEFSLASTGLDISTAGAISNATTIQASGVVTASGGVALQNGGTLTNAVDSEITLTDTSEDLTFDMDSSSNVVGLKSSTGVNGLALGTVDDLTGVGGIAFDAAAASITTATDGDAQDLTLSITGATNSSLVLASSGTSNDALTISTSAGGIDITVAGGAAGEDLDLAANTSINIKSSEASADDSIVIQALGAASGIDITSLGDIDITTTGTATEDISITNTGGSINIRANENDADAIVIDTAGGGGSAEAINILNDQGTGDASIDIDSTAGGLDIDVGGKVAINGADDMNFTLGAGAAAEDMSIALTGNYDASILIDSAGSGTDALSLSTSTNGGDIVISSNDKIDMDSVGTFALNVAGDTLLIQVDSDGANDDLTIKVDGDDDAHIKLDSDGTSADTISIQASAGGIDIDGSTDTITITNTADGAGDDISISVAGATDSSILIDSEGSGTDALKLTTSTNGGDIVISSNDKIDMDSVGTFALNTAGDTLLLQVDADGAADDLTIKVAGAQDSSVLVVSEGTGTDAISLQASAGSIDIDAAALKDVTIGGGQVAITGVDNVGGAISLTTNTGTSETITITNTVGTGAGAITLTSTAGGMTVNGGSGADISVTSTGKSINLTSTEAASDGIAITASTGAGGVTITGGTGGVNAKSAANVGAVVAGTCTAVEYEVNGHHRTVLSLLGGATFNLDDKNDGNGIKIYDFPEGNVVVLGAFMDAVVTSAATVTTSYVMSVGTAIGTDGEQTLTNTEADFVASCTVTCGGGNEDAHGVSALTAAGLVMVPFDGTGGGKDVYLNAAVAAGDISAESAIAAVSGTIVIEWIYLGDF